MLPAWSVVHHYAVCTDVPEMVPGDDNIICIILQGNRNCIATFYTTSQIIEDVILYANMAGAAECDCAAATVLKTNIFVGDIFRE
jgi:hypothetical protein